MAKKDVSKKNIQELIAEIKTFPKDQAHDYAQGEWAKVSLPEPTRVITSLSLAQLTDALINETKIEVTYVQAYSFSFVSDYNFHGTNKDQKENFLLTNEDGGNTAALTITEQVVTKELQVTGIEKLQGKRHYGARVDTDGEYWRAILTQKGVSERNYNAGWDEWTQQYTFERYGDDITWKFITK